MPNRNIYVPDDELAVWDAVVAIAGRRHTSISKLIVGQLKLIAREDNRNTGVPVGFRVPASMKDPVALERERIADDLRAMTLEFLEQADERLAKAAES